MMPPPLVRVDRRSCRSIFTPPGCDRNRRRSAGKRSPQANWSGCAEGASRPDLSDMLREWWGSRRWTKPRGISAMTVTDCSVLLDRRAPCAEQTRETVARACRGLARDLVEIAQMLTSELVTNALNYGSGL